MKLIFNILKTRMSILTKEFKQKYVEFKKRFEDNKVMYESLVRQWREAKSGSDLQTQLYEKLEKLKEEYYPFSILVDYYETVSEVAEKFDEIMKPYQMDFNKDVDKSYFKRNLHDDVYRECAEKLFVIDSTIINYVIWVGDEPIKTEIIRKDEVFIGQFETLKNEIRKIMKELKEDDN